MKHIALIVTLFIFQSTLFAQIPSENIILDLNFEEFPFVDQSQYQHSIINHEANWGAGKIDSGLQLINSQAFLEIPSNENLFIDSIISISLWYQHQQQASNGSYYSLVEQSADELDGHSRYGIWLQNQKTISFCIEPDTCVNGSIVCQRCTEVDVDMTAGEWYHVASSYDGNSLKLFIDGELKSEKFNSIKTKISTRPYPLTIGTDMFDNSPSYLKATLDEIKIFDIVLTPEQINSLAFNDSISTHNQFIADEKTHIFPNPSYDYIYFQSNRNIKYYQIYNTKGQLVQQNSFPSDNKIQLSTLAQGIYFLMYSDGNQVFQRKIMKQ